MGEVITDIAFGPGISSDLIQEFAARRKAHDEAQLEADAKEKAYREIEETLWEAMLTSGTSSIRIDGLGTCTRTVKGPYASLDDNDSLASSKFEAWCREHGYYDEVYRFAPQMARVNSIVKELRAAGDPIPNGTKVLEHRRIQVLKRK